MHSVESVVPPASRSVMNGRNESIFRVATVRLWVITAAMSCSTWKQQTYAADDKMHTDTNTHIEQLCSCYFGVFKESVLSAGHGLWHQIFQQKLVATEFKKGQTCLSTRDKAEMLKLETVKEQSLHLCVKFKFTEYFEHVCGHSSRLSSTQISHLILNKVVKSGRTAHTGAHGGISRGNTFTA